MLIYDREEIEGRIGGALAFSSVNRASERERKDVFQAVDEISLRAISFGGREEGIQGARGVSLRRFEAIKSGSLSC